MTVKLQRALGGATGLQDGERRQGKLTRTPSRSVGAPRLRSFRVPVAPLDRKSIWLLVLSSSPILCPWLVFRTPASAPVRPLAPSASPTPLPSGAEGDRLCTSSGRSRHDPVPTPPRI